MFVEYIDAHVHRPWLTRGRPAQTEPFVQRMKTLSFPTPCLDRVVVLIVAAEDPIRRTVTIARDRCQFNPA